MGMLPSGHSHSPKGHRGHGLEPGPCLYSRGMEKQHLLGKGMESGAQQF